MLATVGLDRRVARRLRLAVGEGLVGTIAARQLVLRLEKASEHPPTVPGKRRRSVRGVPRGSHRAPRPDLGVLVVQDRAPRRFDDEDEAFLYP